jgi:tellurite resistance protein TerC
VLHWGHGINENVPEIATNVSLVVIIVVLAITTVASIVKVRSDPTARAHAGSLRAQPKIDAEQHKDEHRER